MEIILILGIPLLGGLLLAVFGGHRWAPELNVVMSLGTFVASAWLTARIIANGPITAYNEQFFIDPFNVFLVTLTAFVALTTALFSSPYMHNEAAHGKLSAGRLRLYHSMYQLFTFTMLLALTTNNMGILWVAMEAATLTTVMLVSLYRTPA
ncbi:MAG TPA: hydrogenase 4 subunit F, partial [Rhodocyclaceae bacterium]|nr:hydrogenase 4 subunit F [Rhodocyclaceae bacterium]